jgi:hypothetical protein
LGAGAAVLGAFVFPLAATAAVEAVVAALLGLRSLCEQGVIAAMNAMTNPALVFLLLLAAKAGVLGPVPVAVLECAVVLVEWRVLRWALPGRVSRPLAVSLALNAASFAAGLGLARLLPAVL